jgi:hypothetical protein
MNLEIVLAALFGWPLLIIALAIYSITRLITEDSIIDGLRDSFFTQFPPEGYTTRVRPKRGDFIIQGQHYVVTKGTKLGELISCPWCSGFWVSGLVFLAFWAWPVTTTFVLVPMALRVVPGIMKSLTSH